MVQLKQTLLSPIRKVDPGQVHTQDSQRNGTELGQSVAYKGQSQRLHTLYLHPVGAVPFVGHAVTVLRKQRYSYQQSVANISSQEIYC